MIFNDICYFISVTRTWNMLVISFMILFVGASSIDEDRGKIIFWYLDMSCIWSSNMKLLNEKKLYVESISHACHPLKKLKTLYYGWILNPQCYHMATKKWTPIRREIIKYYSDLCTHGDAERQKFLQLASQEISSTQSSRCKEQTPVHEKFLHSCSQRIIDGNHWTWKFWTSLSRSNNTIPTIKNFPDLDLSVWGRVRKR